MLSSCLCHSSHHRRETALIKVVNYLRINADSKKQPVSALLDLSAAFDTVDPYILIKRLGNWVGLAGPVLNWFKTYLTGREYFVTLGDHSSKNICMTCGVPQGSILGPLLFSLYMLPFYHEQARLLCFCLVYHHITSVCWCHHQKL